MLEVISNTRDWLNRQAIIERDRFNRLESQGSGAEQVKYVRGKTSRSIEKELKRLEDPGERFTDQTLTSVDSMIDSRDKFAQVGRQDLVKQINQLLLKTAEEVSQTLSILIERGFKTPQEAKGLAEKLVNGADILTKLRTKAGY